MQTVLLTGGAGYIGSHATLHLLNSGFRVIVLDNLYSGFSWAVDPRATFVEGSIHDGKLIEQLVSELDVSAVVHFAGHIVVPESVSNPIKYYLNNVSGSIALLEACQNSGVNQFVFSSSAAVYGIPDSIPVAETTPTNPINPYGTTKLMTESTLVDMDAASEDFNFVALRYFNVAGAHIHGGLGQCTPEATHLIKVACQTANGQRPQMSIYGDDYDTEDGTCVRDYIHVDDLAKAHVNAVNYLQNGGNSLRANCGYGRGYTVKQVIEMVKKVSGVDFDVVVEGRRAGDPGALMADNSKIKQVLGWRPELDDLETICRSAFEWEQYLLKSE